MSPLAKYLWPVQKEPTASEAWLSRLYSFALSIPRFAVAGLCARQYGFTSADAWIPAGIGGVFLLVAFAAPARLRCGLVGP